MADVQRKKEDLTAAEVYSGLPDSLRAIPVQIFAETDSTNRVAKELVRAGAVHGTTVIAETQTAGRGRQGRSFFSPAETGLYMSVVLRAEAVPDAQLVTVQTAVAVCRAVEKLTGLRLGIKWVNDLYLHGRKVCGILAEAVAAEGEIQSIVVGIGINCTTVQFPEAISGVAGALGAEGLSRGALAAEILTRLLEGGLDGGMEEYRARSLLIGRQVTFGTEKGTVTADVLDVNERGNLVVRNIETGQVLSLFSGEVSVQGDLSDKE